MAKGVFPLVNVSNLDKSLEFYGGLGLKTRRETEGPMAWGTVLSGDGAMLVVPKDIEPQMEQPADTRAWLTGELGKGVLIQFGVANAEKAWAKAQELRATVDAALQEQPWGGMGFRVVDPDGYVIAVSDKFPVAPRRKPARKAAAKPAGKAAKKGKPKRAR